MFNPSNALSLLRGPLAFLFLSDSPWIRTLGIIGAMITDYADGYLARRYKYSSQLGAALDPVMDKFFVYFGATVLYLEKSLAPWQFSSLIARDFFLCLFAVYLFLAAQWKGYKFNSVRFGKITTAVQFLVLIALSWGVYLPNVVYLLLIAFGSFTLLELLLGLNSSEHDKSQK